MINLDFSFEDEPFPLAKVDGLFNPNFIKGINERFPIMPDNFSEMFGRKKIEKKWGPNSFSFLEKGYPEWLLLVNFMNSKDFIFPLLKKAKPFLNETKIDFTKPINLVDSRNTGLDDPNYLYLDFDISTAHDRDWET